MLLRWAHQEFVSRISVPMSRIAGVIGLHKPEESESLLQQLLRPMQREVSDVTISCGDSSILALCGAIVSPSVQSTSLVWNEQRNVACLVSATAFTSETDRQRLRTHGHQLMEWDDIGHVHLYEEHVLRSLRFLKGCFNVVLFELRRR